MMQEIISDMVTAMVTATGIMGMGIMMRIRNQRVCFQNYLRENDFLIIN